MVFSPKKLRDWVDVVENGQFEDFTIWKCKHGEHQELQSVTGWAEKRGAVVRHHWTGRAKVASASENNQTTPKIVLIFDIVLADKAETTDNN